MLVRNYCNKVAKEFTGNSHMECPVKNNPELCPFGDLCWVHPAEATEEVRNRIYTNYEEFYKETQKGKRPF